MSSGQTLGLMPADFAHLVEGDTGQAARPLVIVDQKGFGAWRDRQSPLSQSLAAAASFSGAKDSVLIVPTGDARSAEWIAVAGVAGATSLSPWCLAKAAEVLPPGTYRPVGAEGAAIATDVATLGWILAQHRFDRYKKEVSREPRVLLMPESSVIDARVSEARAVALVRDLVDTPALDMGPAELEAEVARLASASGGTLEVTRGDDLTLGYPMIHGVGMAASPDRAPRLIELEWGDLAHPRLTVVGKGVCFDTGGLDIKPSAGMRLMKKDMGGAAHAIALAQLVLGARLPVRLHLLVPAVENSIASEALRPGDVLTSRAGLSVEIANTDAEGRLILADALTRACEREAPDFLVDFATLTGAARVALGPDLPALFTNDDAIGDALLAAGRLVDDAVWRLPLHDSYDDMLKSDVAELNNSPDGGFAGAITAALFLRRFVDPAVPWVHLDTFAWRPAARPGRPKGGEALGLRAVWHLVRARYAQGERSDDDIGK